MDKPIFQLANVGEYGLDGEPSLGQGPYYVKLYDGSYDAAGFDTEEEARLEFEFLIS